LGLVRDGKINIRKHNLNFQHYAGITLKLIKTITDGNDIDRNKIDLLISYLNDQLPKQLVF